MTAAGPSDVGGKLGKCQWLHGESHARNFCGRQTTTLLESWCSEHRAIVCVPVNKPAGEDD